MEQRCQLYQYWRVTQKMHFVFFKLVFFSLAWFINSKGIEKSSVQSLSLHHTADLVNKFHTWYTDQYSIEFVLWKLIREIVQPGDGQYI